MAGLKELLNKREGDADLQEKVKTAGDENAAKEGELSEEDLENVAGGKRIRTDKYTSTKNL